MINKLHLPNLNSIVYCLNNSSIRAFITDILCKTALENEEIKVLWQGKTPLKNTFYFANKKKTIYTDEINLIKERLL